MRILYELVTVIREQLSIKPCNDRYVISWFDFMPLMKIGKADRRGDLSVRRPAACSTGFIPNHE